MDNQTLQAIKDAVSRHDSMGIMVGKNPSVDEMGAALSLYLGLKANSKQVSIACPTDPLVEIASLVGINKVKKNLEGEGGDLIVSFPYRERENSNGELEPEIQKVSYTLENGCLNIVVKSGENGLSFSEKDVQYRHSGGMPSLLFVVGTARLSDLGNLFNVEALKDTTVINIDNKQDNQGFGDVVFVSVQFSSVSEQMVQVLNALQIPLDIDIAQNLLSGITAATNNFADPKTSATAFEVAASLMKKGAVRPSVVAQQTMVSDASFYSPLPNQPQRFDNRQKTAQVRQFPRQAQQFPPQQRDFTRQQNTATAFPRQRQQPSYQQQVNSLSGKPPMEEQKAQRPMPSSQQQNQKSQPRDEEAPSDWLTPRVYKGSTLV